MLTILNNSAVISFCRNLISQSWANDSALLITRSVCVSIYVLICPVFVEIFISEPQMGLMMALKGIRWIVKTLLKGSNIISGKRKTLFFRNPVAIQTSLSLLLVTNEHTSKQYTNTPSKCLFVEQISLC